MRDLTKWPRLIVIPAKPEPLTREQANEILIRTNSPYLYSNDHAWERTVREILGHPRKSSTEGPSAGGIRAWIEAEEEWRAGLGILDLHYLYNSRIMSAWIGGPKGWVDWDGNVGCSTWNIGKWPSYEEVQEDWDAIAAAFPYLDFHAQLITDEGDGDVAAQWRIADGKAAMVEPIERFQPQDLDEASILFRFTFAGGERGVSLERLREAVEQVRNAV